MECRYCRAWNSEDEHRCRHCGRRLHPSTARPAPEGWAPVTTTATAPAWYENRAPERAAATEVEAQPRRRGVVYQPPLFSEMPQVMPVAAAPARAAAKNPARRGSPRRTIDQNQARLDFPEPLETLQPAVAPSIYCDRRVADPMHRAVASVLDGLAVLAALASFLACLHFGADGVFALDKLALPVLGGVAAAFWLFYQALFCFGNGETPGRRSMGLRLVTLDGHRPTRNQRFYRLLTSCLSIGAVGLGLIWAFADGEHLTWQDLLSGTFPTPE